MQLQSILFKGNQYKVNLPKEDAAVLQQELSNLPDLSDEVKSAGQNRWLLTPNGAMGLPSDQHILLDLRVTEKKTPYDTTSITFETEQETHQKVTDLWLFTQLQNICQSIKSTPSTLENIVKTLVETMQTSLPNTQVFGYNTKLKFPEIDYPNILPDLMLNTPNGFKDSGKRTYLIEAIANGDRSFIDALLAHPDIDINKMYDSTSTAPIGWATYKNDIETVKKLLQFEELKINLAATDDKKTALSYAKKNNNQDLIDLLLAHGASLTPEFAR